MMMTTEKTNTGGILAVVKGMVGQVQWLMGKLPIILYGTSKNARSRSTSTNVT